MITFVLLLSKGKVHDVYLLFVTTERIFPFDVILKIGIPEKRNLLTLFWFDIPNYFIMADA